MGTSGLQNFGYPYNCLRQFMQPQEMRLSLAIVAGFAVWVTAYCIAFLGSAWHPTDYEHIPSLAWRLIHGEVPYRDFIYHKTPGTLFLHSVWFLLPEEYQVRASRAFVYVQIAAATAIPIIWAVRRGVIPFGWRLVFPGVATTAIALHNFPIMPWYTVDGVFFGSLGCVFFLESTSLYSSQCLAVRCFGVPGIRASEQTELHPDLRRLRAVRPGRIRLGLVARTAGETEGSDTEIRSLVRASATYTRGHRCMASGDGRVAPFCGAV
jgi:hypothetical protein